MTLYLMRHGEAEDRTPDSERRLTPRGRERSRAVARQAAFTPSLILTSPYVRAVETAEAVAAALNTAPPIVRIQSLVPHGRPEAVWNDLNDYRDETSILLTSHEPLLSTLAAWLLDSPALRVDMKKSAIVRIDLDSLRGAPRGVLRWMLVPSLL